MKLEHLYERVGATEPGRWSHFLRELSYQYGHHFSEEFGKGLLDCCAYLEARAMEQLEAEVPPWVEELKAKRQQKVARKGE